MMSALLKRTRRQDGFTLIELLVVVAILGILAVAVTPKVLGAINKANTSSAISSAATLQLALERYATDNSDYPQSAAITGQVSLANVLANYIALTNTATPTTSQQSWTFVSYAYTAGTGGAANSYTLTIQDRNQTPIVITITPGSITHT